MRGKYLFTTLLMVCLATSLEAQQIEVDGFKQEKRTWLKRLLGKAPSSDKQFALLDLYTTEKGFSFIANGKDAAEAKEGDGLVTVKLPHKTRYLTVKHQVYGQYTWRVPKKWLKRKKHYRANLLASDPTHEYKLQQQWVVLNVSPGNAIVQIDSVHQLIRDGSLAAKLSVGSHTYTVEAPFYEALTDSFVLSDTAKLVLDVRLQPVYSYLTVKTPWKSGRIFVDGLPIGQGEGVSGRLIAGSHQVSVFLGTTCCYLGQVDVDRAEKKTIVLNQSDFSIHHMKKPDIAHEVSPTELIPSAAELQRGAKPDSAQITLSVADGDTEIWLDRERIGLGQWSGPLAVGYHLVSTKKDGLESEPTELWITDTYPQEIKLAVPQTSTGMVNIHANVVGAVIRLDGKLQGVTPLVLSGLSPKQDYLITVSKEGYMTVKKRIRPKGNEMTDVSIKMKKISND